MEGSREFVPFLSSNSIITKRKTSHSNRANLPLGQTILVPLNLQNDLTKISNFKITGMHSGRRICPAGCPCCEVFPSCVFQRVQNILAA